MKMSFRILFWGSTAKWKLEMLLCHLTEPVYIWMAVKNVGICRCVSETWEAVRVSDDDRGIYWRQIDQLPFTTKCSLSTHHSLLQSVSCGSSNKSLRSAVSWSDPSQYLDSFLQRLLHTITSIWEFNARVWKYGWPMENHGAWPSQVRNYKIVFKTNPKLLIFILIMNRFRKLKTREDMLDYHKRIPWSMLVCIRERFVWVHFHFM